MLLSNGNTGQTFSLCLFPHWKHYYVCSVKVKAIKAHSTEICFEQPLKSLEHNKIYREKTSRLFKWISECNSAAGHNDFSMQSIIYTLCWSQYPPPTTGNMFTSHEHVQSFQGPIKNEMRHTVSAPSSQLWPDNCGAAHKSKCDTWRLWCDWLTDWLLSRNFLFWINVSTEHARRRSIKQGSGN